MYAIATHESKCPSSVIWVTASGIITTVSIAIVKNYGCNVTYLTLLQQLFNATPAWMATIHPAHVHSTAKVSGFEIIPELLSLCSVQREWFLAQDCFAGL